MKLVKIILLLMLCHSATAQDTLRYSENGLTEALAKAKATNKPVFFMLYATWCTHCKAMKENVFTDPSVAAFFNQNFICYAQDVDKGEGPSLREKFKTKSTPSFLFLDSTGTLLYASSGEMKVSEFINDGKMSVIPQKQLPFLQKLFEADVSHPEKCYNYLRALKKGELDYSSVLQRYFATKSEKDLLTETNWKIITNGVKDIKSREFQYVLSHQKEFAAITSQERVERKIVQVAKDLLQPLATQPDSAKYFLNRKTIEDIHLTKTDSVIFSNDLTLYEKLKNWGLYRVTSAANTNKYVWNNSSTLKSIVKIYTSYLKDTEGLKMAASFMERSIELNPEYDSYVFCAKIYKKLNDKPKAIQTLEKGKDVALKYGWNHDEADKLLSELQK